MLDFTNKDGVINPSFKKKNERQGKKGQHNFLTVLQLETRSRTGLSYGQRL